MSLSAQAALYPNTFTDTGALPQGSGTAFSVEHLLGDMGLGVAKETQLFVGNYWYEASEENIKEDEFLVWGKAPLEKRKSIEQALNRLLSS